MKTLMLVCFFRGISNLKLLKQNRPTSSVTRVGASMFGPRAFQSTMVPSVHADRQVKMSGRFLSLFSSIYDGGALRPRAKPPRLSKVVSHAIHSHRSPEEDAIRQSKSALTTQEQSHQEHHPPCPRQHPGGGSRPHGRHGRHGHHGHGHRTASAHARPRPACHGEERATAAA